MTVLAVALALVAGPETAVGPVAIAAGDRADCPRALERDYSRLWWRVRRVHGKRAPGRNIRRDGVLFRGVVFDAVCSELARSRQQLRQLLTSPPYSYSRAVPPPQPPAGVKSDATESVGGSSNGMVDPYCESAGNPQAVDPSGTYWGWYQFDYTTWVAHGGAPGEYGNAPLYRQHQVAARVHYDAWPNC